MRGPLRFLASAWHRRASTLLLRSGSLAGERIAQPPQVWRQRGLEAQLEAGHRMWETEHRRVQSLPGEGCEANLGGGREPHRFALETRRIDGIAQDRMTDMRQMDADLMGSPRLQPA